MVNLLFDYDGTLHDSLAIYTPAVQEAYDTLVAQGHAAPKTWTEDTVRGWIGLSAAEMWNQFQPHLSPQEKQAGSAQIGRRMLELADEGKARLYPGVPQVLDKLKERGLRLLLLSNCPVVYLQTHAFCFDLGRWFEGLYCAEEFGYIPKRDILPILRQLWPGDFLVIGDRALDVEMARQNHVPAVGCLYGYGGQEELGEADWLAKTPEELLICIDHFLHGTGTGRMQTRPFP